MASKFNIIMMLSALNSLNDIHEYIEYCSNNPVIADNVRRRIILFIDKLSEMPFIGRKVDYDKVQGKNIRRITFDKKYNIFYRVDEQAQTVYILKIANGKQNVDRQLFGL